MIGYRVFVRYPSPSGKRLRGLYILRSETDKKLMAILGNLFTHYQYHTTDITQLETAGQLTITSRKSDLRIVLAQPEAEVPLPPQSPFANWSEARRYAGPLPFTFSVDPGSPRILIVEGVRQHWVPQPLAVESCHVGFVNSLGLSQAVLANAFAVDNVPYYWKKGRTELWSH